MANVPQIIREEEGSRLRSAYTRAKLTKRMTQADIAAQCGWQNASTFNRLLSGQTALTLDSLTKITAALGVAPAAIAPRLVQDAMTGIEARRPMNLPVSQVKVVTRGSWGEPFLTTMRLPFFTADPSAFALSFDDGEHPAGLDGWLLVVEPARPACVGDSVIVKHGAGKYSYGRIQAMNDEGGYTVEVAGRGAVSAMPRRCLLVSTLTRAAELT